MIENTISIECSEALADEVDNNTADTADMQKKQEGKAETEKAELTEEKGQQTSETETNEEDEDMLTLTVYGDTVKVSREEAISAAQRGLAFDRMKQKLNLAKNDGRLRALDKLSDLCGKSVPQMLGDMAGKVLVDGLIEKYGSAQAVPKHEAEALFGKLASTRAEFENAADVWTLNDKISQLEEFWQHNPNCREIPQQVIEATKRGENLSLAYSEYKAAQLAEQLEEAQREISILKSRKAAKEKSMPQAGGQMAEGTAYSMYGMMKSLW